MMDEIEVVTGDRRDMIDRLLEKASELLGSTARCGFRSCYGQTEEVFQLTAWSDKGRTEWDIPACRDHLGIVSAVTARCETDQEMVGFFATHLDEERFPLRDAIDQIRS